MLLYLDNPIDLPLFTRDSGKNSFHLPPTFSHRLEYLATQAFIPLLRLMPRRCRSAFGGCLGQLIYYIGIRTKVTKENLHQAFPNLPSKAVSQVARRVYRHFGRVSTGFVVLAKLSRNDLGTWIHVTGFDVLDEAIKSGKGGIVFSGHLGNWEIMGAIASQCGYPVTFVVASQSNVLVEDLIDRFRASAGIEIIKRRDAIRGVLSALQRNRLVAILIDQDAHEDGVFVPFFGRPASTPRGPSVFHLRTGSPLIFAQSTRLPGDHYRIRFVKFPTTPTENADEITSRMSARLEAAISETPEQWFWMHRRWKTRPPESSS